MKKIFYYFKSRKVRIAVLIAALSMVACMAGIRGVNQWKRPEKSPAPVVECEEPPRYISDTAPEDCLLCNGGKGTLLPWYGKQENVGFISLNTKDIRLLEPDITAFVFNDYYISCDLRERREEDSCAEMDFLIFYCPERYKE